MIILLIFVIMLIIIEYSPAAVIQENPPRVFLRLENQTPPALLLWPYIKHFDALNASYSPANIKPVYYTILYIKRLKRAFKRVITAYTAPVYVQAKSEKPAGADPEKTTGRGPIKRPPQYIVVKYV